MLDDLCEYDTGHVRIVGCLVIVRKQSLSIIVRALVFCVKTPTQIVLKLVIVGALFIYLSERRVIECLRVRCDHFGVVGMREEIVPFLTKFSVSFRQRRNELIVEIEPIVHAVVTDNWLFGVYHGLHYE